MGARADDRTVNLVHYPLGDATDPRELGTYLDGFVDGTGSVDLANTGLKVRDTGGEDTLTIKPGSDLSTDRTLTITTGDADRTLTLSGNATISGTNTGDEPSATTSAEGLVELATDAEVRSAGAVRAVTADLLESAAAGVAVTSSSNATAVNWDAGINFTLTTNENTAISNPTNGQAGTWRTILVQGNDGTSRVITFDSAFLGEVPTITDCTSTKWYLLMVYCVSSSHFVVSSKVAKS